MIQGVMKACLPPADEQVPHQSLFVSQRFQHGVPVKKCSHLRRIEPIMTGLARILIVHHRALVCEGLRAMLASAVGCEVVGICTSGAEALEVALRLRPDILLTEPRLPDGDGIALTRHLLAAQPKTRVLMITDHWCVSDALQAKAAGASGYLANTLDRHHLLAAITQLLSGGWCVPFDQAKPPRGSALGDPLLSPREREVLQLMRQGRSNIEIGKALHISSHTVLSHAKSLFQKLAASSRAEAVTAGFEMGYLRTTTRGKTDGSWHHH